MTFDNFKVVYISSNISEKSERGKSIANGEVALPLHVGRHVLTSMTTT